MERPVSKNSSKRKKQKHAEKYKKFIGNKVEVQGFADKRKRKMKYEYLKLQQKEKQKGVIQRKAVTEIYDKDDSKDTNFKHRQTKKRTPGAPTNKYESAKLYHKRKNEERKVHVQEMFKQKTERESALKQYKEKKINKHKKLSKKTYRGQPVMKNHIEALLEKIQKEAR